MSERALTTQQQAQNALAKHLQVAKALEEQAQISGVERLAAEAAFDRARVTTRAVKAQRDSAHNALASLTHVNYGDADPYQTQSFLVPATPLFTLPALPPKNRLRSGLVDHPRLQVLTTKYQQALNIADASRGLYQPDVFLFGNYNVYENDSLASDLSPDWLVGVGVRVALMDRSGRNGKIGAADNTVREVESLKNAA